MNRRLTAVAMLAFSCLTTPALPFLGEAQAAQPRQVIRRQASRPGGESEKRIENGTLQQGFRAAAAGQWRIAEQDIAKAHDPLAAKIFNWLSFSEGNPAATFTRIRSFLRENPGWPALEKMELAAEKTIPSTLPDEEVTAWFRNFPPRTADGMSRFADSLLNTGARNEAAAALKGWWPDAELNSREQAQILSRYGSLLTKDADISRFNKTMAKRQYTNARPLAARLGRGYPQLAEARILLAGQGPGTAAAIARVPAELQDDAGLLYERLRVRIRGGDTDGAIEILNRMPQGAQLYNAGDWWKLRDAVARDLINHKQYGRAYDIVSAHGPTAGADLADGEFQAGWLALRFLNRPDTALHHFETLYRGTTSPLSHARGAYWAGRASEVLGDQEGARRWYREAAFHETTFYGRLADEKLAPEYKPAARVAAGATPADRAAFDDLEKARAARLFAGAGMDNEAKSFLDSLAASCGTAGDCLLAADLAGDLGYLPKSVQIAKDALQKGFLIPGHLYPAFTGHMDDIRQNRPLVHALIRQESIFDTHAVSSSGARGLMQLMPAAAREMAQKAGVVYSSSKLLANPAYNIRLGTTYLAQLLDHYGYKTSKDKTPAVVLAVAAYNGGPGNVEKWIAANGDPRDPGVDLIDWIELIPFPETRNYVQRVLEGEWVYENNPALQDAPKPAALHLAIK